MPVWAQDLIANPVDQLRGQKSSGMVMGCVCKPLPCPLQDGRRKMQFYC